jgi:hypothetical protein
MKLNMIEQEKEINEEIKAKNIKERVERKYKELLCRYIKESAFGFGEREYVELICIGEVLGYSPAKIREDIRGELNG